MIYIPCFNVLTLPDVSCYFRLDYLNGMSDQPVKAGDKVLFLMLKEQRGEERLKRRTFTPSLSAEWWRALKISGRWYIPPTGSIWIPFRWRGRASAWRCA